MTVQELIEQLQALDPQAEVQLATNYGDIASTTQLHDIGDVGEVEETRVYESGYSQSGEALQDPEDWDDEDPDLCDYDDRRVIIACSRVELN